jgi:hypothetical protein
MTKKTEESKAEPPRFELYLARRGDGDTRYDEPIGREVLGALAILTEGQQPPKAPQLRDWVTVMQERGLQIDVPGFTRAYTNAGYPRRIDVFGAAIAALARGELHAPHPTVDGPPTESHVGYPVSAYRLYAQATEVISRLGPDHANALAHQILALTALREAIDRGSH